MSRVSRTLDGRRRLPVAIQGRVIRAAIGSLVALLLVSCAPAAGPRRADGLDRSGGDPAAPKTLTIGIRAEPTILNTYYAAGGGGANGISSVWDIVNNYLMVQDETYAWIPQLATEPISTEKGTWRLNADGTMETIWRIHPNVQWHDGRPFTADDLAFTFQAYKDPEIPNEIGVPIKAMESATAVDTHTFAIRWSGLYTQADRAPGLLPLPRHILESTQRTDKANFVNSPYIQTEFVGLGPYRVTHWERGSFLTLARHDSYFKGQPRIDTVIFRFLDNTQALVAHLLGGNVDVATALDIDSAVEAKSRWEAAGNVFMAQPSTKFRVLEFQNRAEFARPTNGVTNLAIRHALYHAIERPPLADAATSGLSPIADSWVPPGHELRAPVESAIPQYSFDPRRAQALLAQAGWSPGTDGILIHAPTGDRFEIQIAGESNTLTERESSIVAANWKEIGVVGQPWAMSGPLRNDSETRAKLSGVGWSSVDGVTGATVVAEVLHSKNIARPGNGWFDKNRLGYANPRVDALLDRLALSVSHDEQIALHRGLLQELIGDLPLMPLYWKIDPVLVARGITGVRSRLTFNIYEWDRKPI